ncbi:hypothetical protein ASC77_17170 [Nocardioides sp. Root1257]|uniref:4-oxalomesaconate tautomerase n=1 Tax=unclassified Nocardioides TaxID=2615069 RepID=UPI0006F21CC2|nr:MULTISPECIES: 4-oxalomesaconate tautomerase [unclassified Nocardioides]KQW46927.1 hypothetical protein ASC77_17170 [Nocardioides sp. Root1257]KRC43674.1 hypothetical protein ASE24_18125 [Nocardioides sp. Root224]
MTGVRCALMRGGTSKGAVFVADDLPSDPARRDALLLRIMGSPDARQIDGLGGAHPLTSKVAVVSPSDDPDVDVDYLFLQVAVDRPSVSASQTCGNMLAAVGPFAIERGLVPAADGSTEVRVRLANTGALATLRVRTPGGVVTYAGDTEVTGVPGTAAAVEVVAVPTGKPLFPTGHEQDHLADHDVTCVDNGMPCVVVRAEDLGVTGAESPADLEADDALLHAVRRIRAAAAEAMGLGSDLDSMTVPKIVLVAPPAAGGAVLTRSFIPERVHQAIGVLAAASVAAALRAGGSVAHGLADLPADGDPLRIEHPTGFLDVNVDGAATSVVRTARLLMDGFVHPGPERIRPTDLEEIL